MCNEDTNRKFKTQVVDYEKYNYVDQVCPFVMIYIKYLVSIVLLMIGIFVTCNHCSNQAPNVELMTPDHQGHSIR